MLTIFVPPTTSSLIILHEAAHVKRGTTEADGHDQQFCEILRDYYARGISPEAAEIFWNLVSTQFGGSETISNTSSGPPQIHSNGFPAAMNGTGKGRNLSVLERLTERLKVAMALTPEQLSEHIKVGAEWPEDADQWREQIMRGLEPDPAPPERQFSTDDLLESIQEAHKYAQQRGHDLVWDKTQTGRYRDGRCANCGLDVQVIANPMPNEIDVAGPALAQNCTGKWNVPTDEHVAGAREDLAGLPGWPNNKWGVPRHVYDWLDAHHPDEGRTEAGDCVNPACSHTWTPEEQRELTQYGEIRCPQCAAMQSYEGTWNGHPGGSTRSGLSLDDMGNLGEQIVGRLGYIPGVGQITAATPKNHPVDFLAEDAHGNPWGVEVKATHWLSSPRFRVGGAEERAKKIKYCADHGLRQSLVGVRLNFQNNQADIFHRPQFTDSYLGDTQMTHVGTVDFSDLNPYSKSAPPPPPEDVPF